MVNDVEVSRRHVRIYNQQGQYMVEDLGSTNGTFVNGQRLVRPYLLQPGDMIQLGENVTFSFDPAPGQYDPNATIAVAKPSAPPAAQPQYQPPAAQPLAQEPPPPPVYSAGTEAPPPPPPPQHHAYSLILSIS